MPINRLQKLGSLLGLLAILMATLAPTISQTLAWNQRLSIALDSYCSVSAADAAADASAAAQSGKSPRPAALHWQACAYCGLLAHVPIVPHSAVPLALAQTATHAPAATRHATFHVRFSYAVAQSRAPPFVA